MMILYVNFIVLFLIIFVDGVRVLDDIKYLCKYCVCLIIKFR